MVNTYSWEIRALNCRPQDGTRTNVVYIIHYDRVATDPNGLTARVCGYLEIQKSSTFTKYENLTPEKVCGWLDAGVSAEDINNLNAHLDRLIDEQVNPVSVTPPLPW